MTKRTSTGRRTVFDSGRAPLAARFLAARFLAAGFLAAGSLAVAAVLTIAAPSTGHTAQGDWVTDSVGPDATVRARLISAANSTGLTSNDTTESTPLRAGVEIELPGDWKTYWRSPGDAGTAPTLDLEASTNLADVRLEWPAPERFTLFGLQTFGYGDRVVFPIHLSPESAGEPMALRGRLDALVCDDICVPTSFDLALDLSGGDAAGGDPAGGDVEGGRAAIDSEAANIIDRFRARVPDDGAVSGLTATKIAIAPDLGDHGGLRIAAERPDAAIDPDIIIESAPGWAFGPPTLTPTEDGRFIAEIPATQSGGPLDDLIGSTAIITMIQDATAEGTAASESSLTIHSAAAGGEIAATGAGGASPSATSWIAMIGVALAGGLILNAMPCVLPVLSLKLMSVLGYGAAAPAVIRSGFLWSALGIVTSFMALAGLAIGVKALGGAVGWGMQFQQPLFLVFIVVVLTGFSANLAGLFSIDLPHAAATRLGLAGGARPSGPGGHFATGAFATLLATPCSAPFLGTAVTFALSRGIGEILAIFLALGIGMALPYLLVAAVPTMVRVLPRPGPWMQGIRLLMALALAATAFWLLTVLGAQIGNGAAALVGTLMLAVVATLWARRRLSGHPRMAVTLGATAVAALAFIVPVQAERITSTDAGGDPADGTWASFERAQIARHVAEGQVVFVDVTADWCLTCQVNKAVVLDRGTVADRLAADDVTAMRADWTRPDDAISDFLADYGRYGIPFNIVFGPGAPDGIALPEILSSGLVTEALERAAGSG